MSTPEPVPTRAHGKARQPAGFRGRRRVVCLEQGDAVSAVDRPHHGVRIAVRQIHDQRRVAAAGGKSKSSYAGKRRGIRREPGAIASDQAAIAREIEDGSGQTVRHTECAQCGTDGTDENPRIGRAVDHHSCVRRSSDSADEDSRRQVRQPRCAGWVAATVGLVKHTVSTSPTLPGVVIQLDGFGATRLLMSILLTRFASHPPVSKSPQGSTFARLDHFSIMAFSSGVTA